MLDVKYVTTVLAGNKYITGYITYDLFIEISYDDKRLEINSGCNILPSSYKHRLEIDFTSENYLKFSMFRNILNETELEVKNLIKTFSFNEKHKYMRMKIGNKQYSFYYDREPHFFDHTSIRSKLDEHGNITSIIYFDHMAIVDPDGKIIDVV